MTFAPREAIKVIADILGSELGIAPGFIMVNDQKWNIPKTQGLFISLSYIGPSEVIGNVNKFDETTDPPEEVQHLTMKYVVQIDLMSYNSEARVRKEEVAMALSSQYSQRHQEKYHCQIAKKPEPFIDASVLEAAAMLKRFTTRISVTAVTVKRKAAEYYSTFETPEVEYNV